MTSWHGNSFHIIGPLWWESTFPPYTLVTCVSPQKSKWCRKQFHGMTFHTVDNITHSAAIWRHKSGSTLAQVMACFLVAPSHYLNQCWLIHQLSPVTFIWWQFHRRYLSHLSLNLARKLSSNLPGANELTQSQVGTYTGPCSALIIVNLWGFTV